MEDQKGAITLKLPSSAILCIANPIFRSLLRTLPFKAITQQWMVLNFTGRKSGRRYEVPVVAHDIAGELYALTWAAWRFNFRDGAVAEVSHDNVTKTMHGELIVDADQVSRLYRAVFDTHGIKVAQRMTGLRFTGKQIPPLSAFLDAVKREGLGAVRLDPVS